MQRRATWIIGICGVMAAFLTGCGDASELEVAEVHGRVTCNGEPVPGGEIRFVPVLAAGVTEGPPEAIGQIDENGNFTLSTYSTGDGAVLGKHQVVFKLPMEDLEDIEEFLEEAEAEDESEELAEAKADAELFKKLLKLPGDTPEPGEVTVVTGDNEFNFKLERDFDPEEDD